MILCLDSGNTRLKWGLHEGPNWLAQGAVTHADVAGLTALTTQWPRPEMILLANVAGDLAAERIRTALGPWSALVREVKSSRNACGITSLYQTPERLGVDRWCALIGARQLSAGACVVVMAGTATTIDTLDAEGRFLGGLILPGIDLMRRSLARDTAALPLADGTYASYPQCTEDAIVSGAIEAQLGAIERACRRLPAGQGNCLLSGGNAGLLADGLVIPFIQADNLPLEGLKTIALGMRVPT